MFFPEDHVLVAGDAIMSIAGEPLLGAFNADVEQAKRTFRRLALLEAGIVCVGRAEKSRCRRGTFAGSMRVEQDLKSIGFKLASAERLLSTVMARLGGRHRPPSRA